MEEDEPYIHEFIDEDDDEDDDFDGFGENEVLCQEIND